ncbi:DNA-binding transcriptional LysR family regulator [Crossiella equi]|uniref:DNA-binding transcriptional LysR family regulator n=1 Tax=Crossiella equi TaxID=130796 RepID=A0ABS5AR46_9PSEU|nr:LysR family transcriptional regulator [Crossiella equi]MBP2479026.1 DNA-binding transcriptional LysR family regulator [Crossiella equi]
MNLRHLECFLAVADELHFGRAAQRLGMSPARVSESVADLERTLRGALFERSSRRVGLTSFGADFLEEVRGPLEKLRIAHRLAKVRNEQRDEIVIGHDAELGHLLLSRLLGTDTAELAEDTIARTPWRPTLMSTDEQVAAVAEGRIDLGLGWSAVTRPPLAAVTLAAVPVVAILRADDPLALASHVHFADLRDRQVLLAARNTNEAVHSQLLADFVQGGLRVTEVEEIPRYDDLALHVVSRNRVALHPATAAVLNRVPGAVFRPLVHPSPVVTITATFRQPAAAQETGKLDQILRKLTTVTAKTLNPYASHWRPAA